MKEECLITPKEGIEFVYGRGKYKPEIQKPYEELEECGRRLMEYKECFEIMGKDHNSDSKTDLEAAFMRMKEDHMLNGQLKLTYNVQSPFARKETVEIRIKSVWKSVNSMEHDRVLREKDIDKQAGIYYYLIKLIK